MITNVQWWCSARGTPWDWSWQAYPGVWLSIAACGLWIHRLHKRSTPSRAERWTAWLAVIMLWATLDWPIGPLGAGYLASVHTMQFISLAISIPPLVLFGVRRALGALGDHADSAQTEPANRWTLLATQPVFVAVVFSVVMFATHAPLVVDSLMRLQLGAFALDLAWFGAGLLFWWPVIVRRPGRSWFNPPLRMLYLFFGTQAHIGIAMWLLIAQFPVYATYELAPRVTGLAALDDQQLAGALMIGVVEPLILIVISVIFFRWFNAAEKRERAALST